MRGGKPWTVQPPAGTPIDWDNPLADGLIFVYVPNNCGFDLVSGETGTAVAGVATPLHAGASGVTGKWAATSSLAYANNGYFNPPTVSLMAYARANAPAANTGLLSKIFSGNTTVPSYGLVLNNAGNNDICFSIRQAGAQNGPISAYTPPANESVVLMGTYNGAEAALYAAGVLLAQKAVTGAPQSDTGAGNSLIVSGSSDSAVTTAFSGDIYCGAVWERGLLGGEAERISINPWLLFHKRRRSYSIVQSSGVTASAAILEQSDAISAAATASTSASATILEQPDSITASASLSTTASAAIAEQPDTIAATATLTVSASAAAVEQSDTLAASTTLTVPASAAVTESADSISAAASASTTASAAIVEGYDTLAGTLNVGTTVNASADIAEQYDAISASATLSAAASASIREGRDILSAAAAFALSATAAILESVDTLAASAQASISASANAYSGYDVLVASATVGSSISAAANILAGYDIIQASATVLSPVDAACTVTLLQLQSNASILELLSTVSVLR